MHLEFQMGAILNQFCMIFLGSSGPQLNKENSVEMLTCCTHLCASIARLPCLSGKTLLSLALLFQFLSSFPYETTLDVAMGIVYDLNSLSIFLHLILLHLPKCS